MEPRRSEFGTEITFFWEGNIWIEDFEFKVVESTFNPTKEMKELIDKKWSEQLALGRWDAPKWRYESSVEKDGKLIVSVSKANYKDHNILKHLKGLKPNEYVNPITICTLMTTSDGVILAGLRGKESDQNNVALIGSGFIELRKKSDGSIKPPAKLGYHVLNECLTEASFDERRSIDMYDARVLGVIYGSNHDTAILVHIPLETKSSDVTLISKEFKELVLIPNKLTILESIIKEGSYKGLTIADHLIGSLELYTKQYLKRD